MSTPRITAAVGLINGSEDKSTLNPKSEEVMSELSSRQSRAESDVSFYSSNRSSSAPSSLPSEPAHVLLCFVFSN